MRIAVLSQNPTLYSTQRLVEVGTARGHDVQAVDYLRCYMTISPDKPSVIYQGNPLEVDAVIPRIAALSTFYGAAVVRQLEMMGVFTVNKSIAITRSRDKLRCHQLLAGEGIGQPITSFAHSTKDIDGVIDAVGGPPLVVKLLEGTQGVGVVLAETRSAAESVISVLRLLDANILVQEYIKEAGGQDVRAFVVGERVIAAMRRIAPPGEFRANVHRGARCQLERLTPEERNIARRAVRILGLKVAGVDIIRSNRGPVVLEVNSSPGLEGIENITGVDIAAAIYELIEQALASGAPAGKIVG
ncbi:MAG: 30S ribosomal protein S6--L-glutamate ligase [Candidatus Schekmanbacteria bacterium]|nr:30S ribosomal protein S6--L-glutamate ligase [Candidatus Schekmanbacteria bacterium]